VAQPPTEEYMIEGYKNDDAWRMVEDEFFCTARSFTAHLHRAEYMRLQKLVQERSDNPFATNHDVLVNSIMNGLSTTPQGNQKSTDREIPADREDADDPFMKDITFASLMNGDRSSSSADLLIVRKPVTAQPAKESFDTPPLGWVGAFVKRKVAEDDMDLDDVPDSLDRRTVPRITSSLTPRMESQQINSRQTAMWAGNGTEDSATQIKDPGPQEPGGWVTSRSTLARTVGHVVTSSLNTQNNTIHHPKESTPVCPKTAHTAPEPHNATLGPKHLRTASSVIDTDPIEIKKTSLSVGVLTRLAKRKKGSGQPGKESGDIVKRKEINSDIPTFMY
jgi:hypothetical protein